MFSSFLWLFTCLCEFSRALKSNQDPSLEVDFSEDFTEYQIKFNNKTWLVSGDTYFRNNHRNAKLSAPVVSSNNGMDNFGSYDSINVLYTDEHDERTQFINSFKTYKSQPDILVFTQKFPKGLNNPQTDPISFATTGLLSSFPSFIIESSSNNTEEELGFFHFSGVMASGLQ